MRPRGQMHARASRTSEKRTREVLKEQTLRNPEQPTAGIITSMSGAVKDKALECHSYADMPGAAANDTSVDMVTLPGSAGSTPESKKGRMEPGWLELQDNIVKLLSERMEEYNTRITQQIDVSTKSLADLITTNTQSIHALTDRCDMLFADIEEVKASVQEVQVTHLDHQQRIVQLEEKINEMEAHSRRMNLRLYGLPEMAGENVKTRVKEICAAVLPAAKDAPLHILVDVCHRVGIRQENKTRPVIIRFASRDFKDQIWKGSRECEYLTSRKLKFGQDLTSKDKETRNALWPYVEAAKKEGTRAFFVGAKAIIDGKVFKIPN